MKIRCAFMDYAGHVKRGWRCWGVVTRHAKIMYTCYSAWRCARQAVVNILSTQPRAIGQTVHEAIQAIAEFPHRKYTTCGRQKDGIPYSNEALPRKLRVQTPCGAVRATRRRQRSGISPEIETYDTDLPDTVHQVARGAASRLRLKRRMRGTHILMRMIGRQRSGISPEIETNVSCQQFVRCR